MTFSQSSFASLAPNIQLRVMIELEDRRHRENTYTAPLLCNPDMKDFLQYFYRNVYTPEQKEFYQQERIKYPIVNTFYRQLCGTVVSMEDFWQRYEYRCHVERIASQILQEQSSKETSLSTFSSKEKSSAISTPTKKPRKDAMLDAEEDARRLWEEEEALLESKIDDGQTPEPTSDTMIFKTTENRNHQRKIWQMKKKLEDNLDERDNVSIDIMDNENNYGEIKCKTNQRKTNGQRWKDRLAAKRADRNRTTKAETIFGRNDGQVESISQRFSPAPMNFQDLAITAQCQPKEESCRQTTTPISNKDRQGSTSVMIATWQDCGDSKKSNGVNMQDNKGTPRSKPKTSREIEKKPSRLQSEIRQPLFPVLPSQEIPRAKLTIMDESVDDFRHMREMETMTSLSMNKTKALVQYQLPVDSFTTKEFIVESQSMMEEKENANQIHSTDTTNEFGHTLTESPTCLKSSSTSTTFDSRDIISANTSPCSPSIPNTLNDDHFEASIEVTRSLFENLIDIPLAHEAIQIPSNRPNARLAESPIEVYLQPYESKTTPSTQATSFPCVLAGRNDNYDLSSTVTTLGVMLISRNNEVVKTSNECTYEDAFIESNINNNMSTTLVCKQDASYSPTYSKELQHDLLGSEIETIEGTPSFTSRPIMCDATVSMTLPSQQVQPGLAIVTYYIDEDRIPWERSQQEAFDSINKVADDGNMIEATDTDRTVNSKLTVSLQSQDPLRNTDRQLELSVEYRQTGMNDYLTSAMTRAESREEALDKVATVKDYGERISKETGSIKNHETHFSGFEQDKRHAFPRWPFDENTYQQRRHPTSIWNVASAKGLRISDPSELRFDYTTTCDDDMNVIASHPSINSSVEIQDMITACGKSANVDPIEQTRSQAAKASPYFDENKGEEEKCDCKIACAIM